MEEESQHFILMMRNKVMGMDLDYVINMDQTPIPYSYHSLCTLEKKGVRTVHVQSSTADTKQVVAPCADFQGENGWMN